MNVKIFGPPSILNKTLSSQLHVPGARYLSTTLFRALEAQGWSVPPKSPPQANVHCLGIIDLQSSQNTESKQEEANQISENSSNQDNNRHTLPLKAKTVSQADAELRERLEQLSGAGGACGIEYEDGKPNAMKRGVRNNMFRLI
ncbi:hypothetical protein PDIG_71770 [Penicillium digitatum PHI26]|uniref:Uncharacterized protein n=2 Tax=Penicillium digitatum TaxID=36651 RepID=K9G2Y6_PEND2|nr:hypothetical protein PDIP_81040 [Penicillium digitatum Pd1]EKV06006.1 hypothetical protein PDIP_81040 [Penicillium digitatum Pd1]EKV07641.1 hypothetical protein PDIG_71770 [Penicillium digitatum PHI26]